METRLAPGEETLLHSHPIESAVVFLTDAQFRISDDDGASQEESVKKGDVAFGDSAIVHQTANIGATTARVVTVEIFSLQPPVGDAELAPIGEILMENSKVRIARIKVEPHQPLKFDTARPVVIVAESRGVAESNGRQSSLQLGDALWCDPGTIECWSNTESPFHAVVVMLKSRD